MISRAGSVQEVFRLRRRTQDAEGSPTELSCVWQSSRNALLMCAGVESLGVQYEVTPWRNAPIRTPARA